MAIQTSPEAITDVIERAVPTARTVPSLDHALRLVALGGGSIASETRTAPGIGSWALITDPDGNEMVLWEDAAPIPS